MFSFMFHIHHRENNRIKHNAMPCRCRFHFSVSCLDDAYTHAEQQRFPVDGWPYVKWKLRIRVGRELVILIYTDNMQRGWIHVIYFHSNRRCRSKFDRANGTATTTKLINRMTSFEHNVPRQTIIDAMWISRRTMRSHRFGLNHSVKRWKTCAMCALSQFEVPQVNSIAVSSEMRWLRDEHRQWRRSRWRRSRNMERNQL